MKKKAFLIFLLLIVGILAVGVYARRKEQNLEVFNVNVQTETGIKDELIIAMFIQNIEQVVKEYYKQNLSRDVTVYNYETTIQEIEKLEGKSIRIKFGVTPQVGAHNPIGYDEITFTVDSNGNKQFVDYRHVKTDNLSE